MSATTVSQTYDFYIDQAVNAFCSEDVVAETTKVAGFNISHDLLPPSFEQLCDRVTNFVLKKFQKDIQGEDSLPKLQNEVVRPMIKSRVTEKLSKSCNPVPQDPYFPEPKLPEFCTIL